MLGTNGTGSCEAERTVAYPPRAAAEKLDRGVELVKGVIDAERRRAQAQKVSVPRNDSGIRFSTVGVDPVNVTRYSIRSILNDGPNFSIGNECARYLTPRPPDLHAAVLSFSARILKYVLENCQGKAPLIYKRAGISRKVYSRIVSSDSSNVSKTTALQFAIAMRLDRKDAETLLKSAGFALSETIPLDMVFIYCIENKVWNIFDVNAILVRCSLPALTIS